MKKTLYIISGLILFLIFCEFLSWFVFYQKYNKNCPKGNWVCVNSCSYKFKYEKDPFAGIKIRDIADFGSNHKILLFGCSYAYGAGLEPEQTFGYKLAKKLHAKLWNRSNPGWTISHMYYQTQGENKDFNIDDINENIDAIIYINMPNHINRLNMFYWGNIFENFYNLRYKLEDNKLVRQYVHFPLIHIFFISKAIHETIERIKFSDEKENYKLFISILNESHKNLIKKYPNAKFIIIEYNADDLNKYKKEIEQSGWNLYNTYDILGYEINLEDDKYHFPNDPHPTEAAWDIITDKFVEHNII